MANASTSDLPRTFLDDLLAMMGWLVGGRTPSCVVRSTDMTILFLYSILCLLYWVDEGGVTHAM